MAGLTHNFSLCCAVLCVQVVTTPGAGFGPGGEGFIRLSAFASKENVEEACRRLTTVMAKK